MVELERESFYALPPSTSPLAFEATQVRHPVAPVSRPHRVGFALAQAFAFPFVSAYLALVRPSCFWRGVPPTLLHIPARVLGLTKVASFNRPRRWTATRFGHPPLESPQ